VWQQRLQRERIERVEQALQAARSIQQASLPKEVPEPEGWQISPFYQPAREVGGDFYDFFELDDERLGLVVGDATGKGVPAAL
jgi:serine phosphatase RsbU (regulator of sigma subunit)